MITLEKEDVYCLEKYVIVKSSVGEKSVYLFTIKKNRNRKSRTIFQLWRLGHDRMFCGIF